MDEIKKTRARNAVREIRNAMVEANAAYDRLKGKYASMDEEEQKYVKEYLELLGIDLGQYEFGFAVSMALPAIIRGLEGTK